ncbi:MAG: hypothetical protein WBJ33_01050, partial [Candidatus Nanopelagicales bacterium]
EVRRLQDQRAAGSSGPGFLALHQFIYSSLLLLVFGSLLFGRKAAVPGGVEPWGWCVAWAR